MTPIKPNTAKRLGLRKPTQRRRFRGIGGISVSEACENLRRNLPLLLEASRVDWPQMHRPSLGTLNVAGYTGPDQS